MNRQSSLARSIMPAGPRAMVQWRRLSVFKRLLSPLAALLIWELVCRLGWVEPQLLPAPTAIVARLVEQASAAEFWQHFGITLYRLVVGLAVAIVLGLVLGLAAQLSRLSAAVLDALVRLLAPIPKIALYPAFILILGFENTSKIALIVADALFPVLMATWAAARSVDQKLIWSARAAGTSRAACLWKVTLPAIVPTVLAGVRVAGVIACVVVFLAEMIASTDGLGHMLTVAARAYRTLDMFVPLVWICALGLALNSLIGFVQRKVDHSG
ncbi:ABC transporter permease [Pusillimonas caeni]|uniref:ABC transporter permease n=1 Tax=Pusillimonas caeni TaxID=1348472 RepID=UPI001FD75068|nr:ABC transporter permease [Pusillimonas caeni]